jgi:hypothetical protein
MFPLKEASGSNFSAPTLLASEVDFTRSSAECQQNLETSASWILAFFVACGVKMSHFARDPSAIQGRVDGNSRAQDPRVIRTANRPNPGDFEEHCRPLFSGR